MTNNQDPSNGWKSVPFSHDADQVVNAMSSSTLLADPNAVAAAASSRVLYYLEATVGYHLADVGPALEKVKHCCNNPMDPSSLAFALHDLFL
jgi:hypothetical protein